MRMLNFKFDKKLWILIISSVIILTCGGVFLYVINSQRVLTKSEYVKEAIYQKDDFEDLFDVYFDQIVSYNGTKEATEKLEDTADKFTVFVEQLKEKLGPKVPREAASHYESMMKAYEIYLEAVDMYKKAVPKPIGEERTILLKEAEEKLQEARTAMKNLK